jgi:hypothetical protein
MKPLKIAVTAFLLGAGMIVAQSGGPPESDSAPARDFSGRWVEVRESTDRSGNKTTAIYILIIKQTGNKLTGEITVNTFKVPGGGSIPMTGYVEGDQLSLTGYSDYQGGEYTHMQLTYKDRHLAGTKKSWHEAPHKWHFDDTQDFDYTRSNENK